MYKELYPSTSIITRCITAEDQQTTWRTFRRVYEPPPACVRARQTYPRASYGPSCFTLVDCIGLKRTRGGSLTWKSVHASLENAGNTNKLWNQFTRVGGVNFLKVPSQLLSTQLYVSHCCERIELRSAIHHTLKRVYIQQDEKLQE